MINYLLDPFIQIENIDGLPVVGAKVYVYYTGSRTLAPIYSDKEGTQQNNPAITDTLGNVTIFADTASFYDVFVYDNNDQFLFSKEYVAPNSTNDADVPEIEVEAGFGIQVHKRYQGNKAIYNVAIDQNETATAEEVAAKQDKLTAGANIEITDQNVINVVQRKELVTENPLKLQRTSNRVKLYLDPAFYGDFKHAQDEVIIGGGSTNYISKITQNENGNVSAVVGNFAAGANINIANNNGNLTISGKDWTSTINSAVSGKLDTSTYNTFTATTNSWDKTPYSGGTGISVNNHQISCTGDITPYTGGSYIIVNNHTISLDSSFITKYRAPKTIACSKNGTRYTIYSVSSGTGIADSYTFTTLYNTSTQKYELELSNNNQRVFYVYIDGVFVDTIGSVRTKIYETADEMKPIKIELVGMGAGMGNPLYKFTAIFSEYDSTTYHTSLYIDYDYNFAINI